MKVLDLIEQFKADKASGKVFRMEEGGFQDFCILFGISTWEYSQQFADGMVKYYVKSWICTDTRVGFAVYMLGNEVVAYSEQLGRKHNEDIWFVSEDAAIKVREFVTICLAEFEEDDEYPILNKLHNVDDYYFDVVGE